MKKIANRFNTFLNIIMAVSLAGMAILVFGNVVLRYVFNSGITWSEEMSRFLFIWMTFLGAIGALRDNEHLGVDILIKRLSPGKKRVVYTISNLLILYVLWLVLDGSWKVSLMNMHNTAPATGLPMVYVYGIGVVMSVCMAYITIKNLYKAWFVKDSIEELTRTVESEEELMIAAGGEKGVVQGGGR
ncbi:TRAP transporter small permease [Bacillaceae bacterium]